MDLAEVLPAEAVAEVEEELFKKGGKMSILIIILILIVVLILLAISYKNKFVVLDNRVKNAWSQIDVQIENRFALIPNLVETVKGYAKHEKETFEGISNARIKYSSAKTNEEKMEASNQLNGFLGRLLAISEAYPELKADSSFINLQNQLVDLENKIRFSRQFYNDTVTKYNETIQMIPANIFANFFNYKEAQLFKADEQAKETPKVKF